MEQLKCAGFDFFNNFDSANLAKVESVAPNETIECQLTNVSNKVIDIPDVEFNIWTRPDCAGTEFQNGNRTWFYFGMRASASAMTVKLNLIDLNRQGKMYSQGMAPVYKVVPGKPHWERIRDKPVHNTVENIFILSFKYKTPENAQSITYFAFTYPFSYLELQNMLNNIDTRMNLPARILSSKDEIYYHRECVCHTLEGRRVELITISSHHNMTSEREVRLKNLFPDENVPRSFKFKVKKVIFISARVHPGETPSTFVFNGILNLLLHRDDHVAIALRRHYVFKLIPFLNPDGVSRGHYRTDTRGVNLNRMYLNPSFTLHPSIYASRALLRYYHYGFEKEDLIEECEDQVEVLPEEDSSVEDDQPSLPQQTDSKLSNKVSSMSLEENPFWKYPCKESVESFQSAEDISFEKADDNTCAGKVCCCKGGTSEHDLCKGKKCEASCAQGDEECVESGIYLYMDMHGHASKKGIFMYGNHFEDVESNVEVMLLPKILSINNHNFHFTACNFTERNMYLKDRRDGMSREGSGRVAVLKLTGLVRSYTLECNYNTGRLVNILPPTIKETNSRNMHTLLVPPKYTPQVFEEVGRALGASILDLTGQNPTTRIPNSEFHTLSGLKDWLRKNCLNELGEVRSFPHKFKAKTSGSHSQAKTVRTVFIKNRSVSGKACKKKTPKSSRPSSVPIERKENVVFQSSHDSASQPGGSRPSRTRTIKSYRPKVKRDTIMRFKSAMSSNERLSNKSSNKSVNHIVRNVQNTNCLVRHKLKPDSADKLQPIQENTSKKLDDVSESSERIQLREICFIRDSEGKKVIAKYKSAEKLCDENLIVAWDPSSSHPQVFSQKQSVVPMVPLRSASEAGAGPSRQGAFRVHNFVRSSPFKKTSRGGSSKRSLRRLGAVTPESPAKGDKLKKRKKAKRKA